MAFRVYLSHSVARELGAIYGMAELAAQKGMQPIVSDRRWSPETPPVRIIQLLQGLDAFVVMATRDGEHLPWVNSELHAALEAGLNPRAVVSVLDVGIQPPMTEQVVTIDRNQLPATISRAVKILEQQLQLEQSQRNLLGGLLLGGLAALPLASRE